MSAAGQAADIGSARVRNRVTSVGIGFTPPRYLVPGDEVRVSIAGIGELVNRFV